MTTPACNIHGYTDYFGTRESVSHRPTSPRTRSAEANRKWKRLRSNLRRTVLEISVSEARQIYRGEVLLFEFLMPSPAIELTAEINQLANRFFQPTDPLVPAPALLRLNNWIRQNFKYAPGATTKIDTPVGTVLKTQTGVCEYFAPAMIAIFAPKFPRVT